MHAPQFQDPQFGQLRVKADGDPAVFRIFIGGQCGFQTVCFDQFIRSPACQQVTRAILFSAGSAKETKSGWFTHDESDVVGRHIHSRAFFHALSCHAEGFEWSTDAR